MALDYTINVPTEAAADVDLLSFVRTNIVLVSTTDTNGAKGALTRTSLYSVASGDKTLPTTITVRCTVRPVSEDEPYGSSSYAIRIDTAMNIVDGATILAAASPANFTLSWNLQGSSMYDETDIYTILQALFSLTWSSVVAGAPQEGNLVNLAYQITDFL